MFEINIHKTEMPKVKKLSHLMTLLRPPVIDAVQGYPLVDESYDTVLNFIKENYGKAEKQTSYHLDELKITEEPENSVKGLRDYRNKICAHVRSLENLYEIKGPEFEKLLIRNLMDSIPADEVKKILTPNKSADFWTINDIIKGINSQIEILEITKSRDPSNKVKCSEPTAINCFYSSSTQRNSRPTNKVHSPCYFCARCAGNHIPVNNCIHSKNSIIECLDSYMKERLIPSGCFTKYPSNKGQNKKNGGIN